MLTAEVLRSRVTLDEATGTFTWMPHPGSANGNRAWDKQWAGQEVRVRIVNDPQTRGRRSHLIRVLGRWYAAHRLVWLYVHGKWPDHQVDHINGDPEDNRLCNLREATHSQNQANKKAMRNNRLGVKGVYKRGRRYIAQMKSRDGHQYLGSFSCPTAASLAYQRAARAMHGEFARG